MNRGWLFILVAIAGLGAGVLSHRYAPVSAEAVPSTDDALAVKFDDLEGKSRALSEWRGKVLVVNFWATWCPPCLKEIPAFVDLQRRLGPEGVQFVGVALDGREEVAAFVRDHAVNYPVLAGEEDVARYMQQMGNTIGALPFTLVFDTQGKVRHVHQGEWTGPEAEAVLKPLLSRASSHAN